MGATDFVRQTPATNRQAKKLSRMKLQVDVPLLIAVGILLVVGLVMVYSSSMAFSIRDTDDNSPYFFFKRQVIFVAAAIVVCFVASRFKYHWLKPLAPFILGAVLIMLVLVLFTPQTLDTPRRGLLGGSVQPSELAKVAIVIYLSVWIGKKKEKLNTIYSGLIPLATILGVTAALIIAQPDVSAMLTVMALGALLFYVGDGDWRVILGIVLLGAVAFGIVYVLFDALDIHYIRERLGEYKIGGTVMKDIHPHIQHALSAVIRGSWFGTPLGEGTSKYIGLPVPWTDSIFAVIVEELGFFGGAGVIGLYLVILWRGLKIADEAEDLMGKLLVTGLTAWIVMEAFINIGVMINLFPVAGNALPLISYGGSMMLTTMGAIGLIFSVNRTTNQNSSSQKRRNLDAAVDLRRGDGGWRVSRPDRSSRTER